MRVNASCANMQSQDDPLTANVSDPTPSFSTPICDAGSGSQSSGDDVPPVGHRLAAKMWVSDPQHKVLSNSSYLVHLLNQLNDPGRASVTSSVSHRHTTGGVSAGIVQEHGHVVVHTVSFFSCGLGGI